MPGLRDLHVLAEPDAQRERIAVEVRQKTRQRSSRGVGLHRRPLASQAHDLGGEGLERVPVEDGSRNEGLVGAIHLEDVRASRRDAHEEPDDACARDDACRPLVFEAMRQSRRAERCRQSRRAPHRVRQLGRSSMVRSRRSRPFDRSMLTCGWLLPKVLGDLSLRLGRAGDADGALDGDALGIAERARREIPEAIERVRAFVIARCRARGTGAALRRRPPASSGRSREAPEARCGSARRRRQPSAGRPEPSAERSASPSGSFCTGSGESHEIRNEGRLGSRRQRRWQRRRLGRATLPGTR